MSIAVMDTATVYTDDGRELPIRRASVLADEMAEGCFRNGITQLWVHGAPDPRLEFPSWANSKVWDAQPAQIAPWVHCIRRGHGEVDLAFPMLDSVSPWCDAPDARTLLHALTLYQREVGLPFHRSPAATAARLLRSLHSGPRATHLEVIGNFPPPALHGNTEAPMAWMRPLSEAERGMRYLHSYDKNGAYLGACAGEFPIGFGEAEHVSAPQMETADLELPGYFLVRYDDDLDMATPPTFTRRDQRYDIAQWVTTPTLRLLRDRNAHIGVTEAWVWRRHHRSLEPWQKRLRDARLHLLRAEGGAARIALGAVKATYSAFTGGYMASTKWDRTGDELYRPDVRHLIIANARCNLIRKVDQVRAADGVLPVAVGGVDTLYFVSDEVDPVKACPPSLTLGKYELRHFKVKDSVEMDSGMRAWFNGEGGGHASRRLAALQRRLSALKRERDEMWQVNA